MTELVAPRLLIDSAALAYFRAEISKDERAYGKALRGGREVFVKRCRDAASAETEQAALSLLAGLPGERLVPELLGRDGNELQLGIVEGIRLFDLLRFLREISATAVDERLGRNARAAAAILLERCLARQIRIQTALAGAVPPLTATPYPFEVKVVSLLAHLSQLLGLAPIGAAEAAELAGLEQRWNIAAVTPFRDATPKNIVIAEPRLSVRLAGGRAARLARLHDLLAAADQGFWHRVAIADIDFASVEHLTPPEDDLISLLAHQATYDLCGAGPGPALADALRREPERAALALFVRYLRFGGRKLSYRILNPQGYAVRFRHDDPLFYFATLPGLLAAICPSFPADHPQVMRRWQAIGRAAQEYRPLPAQTDPYRAEGIAPPHYWQESPLEAAAE